MTAATGAGTTRAVVVTRALVRAIRSENVTFLAAAVAYYAFVSLVPLLSLALVVGTVVGGEQLATAIVGAAGGLLAPAGEEVLRDAVLGAEGRSGATAASVALLVWSGLKLFRGLDAAFSQVYGATVVESMFDQLRDATVVLGAVGAAAGAVIAVGGLLPAWLPSPAGEIVAALTLPGVLVAAFLPIYYVFPDVNLELREVLPGAITAAAAWSVLVGAFRVYAANAGQYDLYGVLGGVLLLVTWLYLAATVIILGAILNAVLAGRTDDGDGADEDEPSSADAAASDGDDEPGSTGESRDADDPEDADEGARHRDVAALEAEVEALRERLEEKTVDRSELESDLRRYVRARLRRGHARGWGPYLVLLYGTAMTLGAFFYLAGVWAVLAMGVIWLSTLGLYALMLIVGVGVRAAGAPGRLLDVVRDWRS